MSKSVVVLFAGQGAQKVGMGRDLAEAYPVARELFAQADEILGYSLTSVMFEGPMEELTRTSRCQPALYAHGLALLAVLKQERPDLAISAAAGLSLGEFTAHAAAGTLDFATGLRLVAARGTFMEQACQATEGSMAAMIGGEESAVVKLAAESGVDVANYNSPGQIVLSGSKGGIVTAVAAAKGHGIKLAKELSVAGAYHSRLMQSAQELLAEELRGITLNPPSIPVVSNFTGRPVSEAAEIRRTLTEQVTGSVRWTESMNYLLDHGHDTFLELGPGGVLTGLMGRIRKGTSITAIEDTAGMQAWLAKDSSVAEASLPAH